MSKELYRMTELFTLVLGLALGYILRTRGDENQIRYARLYEKRATVLADLSEKLYRLHANLESWTSPFQYGGKDVMKDKRAAVGTAFNEFADCLYSNSLWLDEQSMSKGKALLEKVRRLISEYDKIPGTGAQHPPQVQAYLTQNTDWVNNWDVIHEQATTEVGKLRDNIEAEFKEILGMSDVPRRSTTLAVRAKDLTAALLDAIRRLLNWGARNR
jgi:hypothetical protein